MVFSKLIYFAMLVCVHLIWAAEFAFSQNEPNEAFQAMMKTMQWAEKLSSYDLSATASSYIKSTSPPINGVSQSEAFSERIEKYRELKSGQGDFFISKGEGYCKVNAKNGSDNVRESLTLSCLYGDLNSANRLVLLNGVERPSDDGFICGGKGRSCISVLRGFDWGRLPLFIFIGMTDADRNQNLDQTLEHVLLQKDWHVEKVRSKEKKRCRVLRFAKSFESVALGYRITVSDEGFDKGLVIDFHRVVLKDVKNKKFVNDDQGKPHVRNSSTIEWQELESGEKTLIVPRQIVHNTSTSPFSKATKTWTLNYNSVSEPDKSLMSVTSCKKICDEFGQEIERALGR